MKLDAEHLPESIDLRSRCPPIYDQGELGSCTANSVGGAYEYDEKSTTKFMPSRLFLYYNTRLKEHTQNEDSGCTIRDTIKTIAQVGICPEDMWPYDISQFSKRPPDQCYQVATHHKALTYSRVSQTEDQIEGCLASGYPICFGIQVYESFEGPQVTRSGAVPMPNRTREALLGGHAIELISYDHATRRFGFRNSWGVGWGDKGYGTLPYEYVLDRNLSSDFWVIRTVD